MRCARTFGRTGQPMEMIEEIVIPQLIENQSPAFALAAPRRTAPRVLAAASPARPIGRTTPRGGCPRDVHLPLCVRPAILFRASGGQK